VAGGKAFSLLLTHTDLGAGGERKELLPPPTGYAGKENLPEGLTLRGGGVVPKHQTPQSRDSAPDSLRLFPGAEKSHLQ
jgi:hypothetical protein